MNGLTATGVTVGICAGLWQLVSSHVGLSQGWELLGTIGFVAFCSFYAAGGGKSGFIRSLAVNYSGMVWAFFAALTDKYGKTPLELARERGFEEIAQLLIAAGA